MEVLQKQNTKRETGESVLRDATGHDARGIIDLSLKKKIRPSLGGIRKPGQVKLQIKIIMNKPFKLNKLDINSSKWKQDLRTSADQSQL